MPSACARSTASTARWRRSRTQVGFKGSLQDFAQFLRTDARFKPATRGGDARRLLRHRQASRADGRAGLLDHPEVSARYPARAAVQGKGRSRRRIPAGHARRLTPRHLLLQQLRPALALHLGLRDAVPARGAARPSLPDQPRAGEYRPARRSSASAATPPMSRAGRCTRKASATSSASSPIRTRTMAI